MGSTDKISIVPQAALDANQRKEEAASCVTHTGKDDKIMSTLPPHLRAARAKQAMKLKTIIEPPSLLHSPNESILQNDAVNTAAHVIDSVLRGPTPSKAASSGPNTAENTNEAQKGIESSVSTSRTMKLTIVEDDDVRHAAQRAVRSMVPAKPRTADDVWVKVDYKNEQVSDEQEWDMIDEFHTKSAHKG
ncbi:hypothetical protein LTR17_006167 [Elasticomyces elasticus]|nr:hypothetical protein LTR17_006167 [Elasticomyces elasticus]